MSLMGTYYCTCPSIEWIIHETETETESIKYLYSRSFSSTFFSSLLFHHPQQHNNTLLQTPLVCTSMDPSPNYPSILCFAPPLRLHLHTYITIITSSITWYLCYLLYHVISCLLLIFTLLHLDTTTRQALASIEGTRIRRLSRGKKKVELQSSFSF